MKRLSVLLTRKVTAVRIIPYGKEGDMLELGGLRVCAGNGKQSFIG